jgi:hypothetical protein
MNDPQAVRVPAFMIVVATLLLLIAVATMHNSRGWLPTALMATAILLVVASAAVSSRLARSSRIDVDDTPVPQGALVLVSAMIAVGLAALAATSRSGADFIGRARGFLPMIVGLALLSFVIARVASRRAGAYTAHHAMLALGILLAGRSTLPRGAVGGSSAILGGALAIGALVAMMLKARPRE